MNLICIESLAPHRVIIITIITGTFTYKETLIRGGISCKNPLRKPRLTRQNPDV